MINDHPLDPKTKVVFDTKPAFNGKHSALKIAVPFVISKYSLWEDNSGLTVVT
jgi:hypothetical protein